jgi:hypothetical protein
MTTPSLLQGLRNTVRQHDAAYQHVREREAILAPHPTACALFDALEPRSTLDWDARRVLLRVIVLEYQLARHPLWYALAARGLEPMLARLRARSRGRDARERDQELHLAFAEVLGRLRVARESGPVFPLLTLRRALERALFPRPTDEEAELEEEESAPRRVRRRKQAPHEDPPQFVQLLAREVAVLLVRRSGSDDAVRVLAGAETLAEQVERRSTEDLTKACLEKRHRRALEAVRGDLARRPR